MRIIVRNKRRRAAHLCAAALILVFAGWAHADTIQDNYGPFGVNFLSGNTTTGTLPGFDPTLGTLTSVDFTYTSTATLIMGNAISSNIQISDSLGTTLAAISFSNFTGRAQQTQMGSFLVPVADFSAFENGNVALTLNPFTACRGSASTPTGCDGFSASVAGTVTYTFTPSPTPVPEPPTLWSLSAGFTGVAALLRRRKANHHF